MITAYQLGERIISSHEEAFTLFDKSSFGEKLESKISYSPIEVLYLVQVNKMKVYLKNKLIQYEKLTAKFKKGDKKIETKLLVYSDLRKKGYIVKSALKFGAEFRIYDKGIKPGINHAKWILYSAKESDKINWHDFAAKNRVAHSTKKNLIIAVIDDESDISYYEVSWLKP